jgi:hypothetical protein
MKEHGEGLVERNRGLRTASTDSDYAKQHMPCGGDTLEASQ